MRALLVPVIHVLIGLATNFNDDIYTAVLIFLVHALSTS